VTSSPDPGGTSFEEEIGFVLPRIPASSGALLFDERGRILVVNPTYKKHWTIPGGIVEADGETPWEACRREVLEEVGIDLTEGRLLVVDFLRPKPSRPGGLRFLFDGGVLDEERAGGIVLQEEELSEYRFAKPRTALELLSGPLRRRVGAGLDVLRSESPHPLAGPHDGPAACAYLEDGMPVPSVR
jgi:8-oxo-dGTP diphosphatase